MSKCLNAETRVEISRRLGAIFSCICRKSLSVQDAVDAFDNFLEDFIDNSLFIDYFKATWIPRIRTWIDALETLLLATIETSAAVESYHYQMKLRLMNETNPNVYKRADWLAYKLGSEVHSYYWLDGYAEKDSFVRYWKDEWKSGFTSWQRALQIPDMDVIVSTGCATVASKNKESHTVLNPGSEFAICDCSWSKMGNLCKHMIKALKIYRERGLSTSSISIFHYTRTLNNILHCPPPDSLIRDHSVALSLSVQMQLNALLNLETTRAGFSSVPFVSESHLLTDSEDVPNYDGMKESDLNLINQTSSVIGNENLISDKVMNVDVETVAVHVQSSPSTSKENQICSFQQHIVVPCQKNVCGDIEGDSDAMIIEAMEAEDVNKGSQDKDHSECCSTDNSKKEITATEASQETTDFQVGCTDAIIQDGMDNIPMD